MGVTHNPKDIIRCKADRGSIAEYERRNTGSQTRIALGSLDMWQACQRSSAQSALVRKP